MVESSSTEDRRSTASPRIFVIVVSIIIIFLFVSLFLAVNALFVANVLQRLVFITGILLFGGLTFVLLYGYSKKELSQTAFGPLCKSLLHEYSLCARCKGFYAGFALFGIILAVNSHIYIDLLSRVTMAPYLFILVLSTVSVPIHGGLRRLEIISSENLLQVIGFCFSVSPYLFASLIVYLTQVAVTG